MTPIVSPEIRAVIEGVQFFPSVSIILPFEPKMSLKKELTNSLDRAVEIVEAEVDKNYPDDMGTLVMYKLRAIINNLNFNTFKKSIAIYVSPVFEKVLYLDIAVEEKILVDESFAIRDLVYSKKQLHKYLVLLLSGKESRMYLVNEDSYIRILSNTPELIAAYRNDLRDGGTNILSMPERKEKVMEKFLQHLDSSLDIILNAYQLPLFVLGTEKILRHFNNLTRHGGFVIDYIDGNYEEASLPQLKKALKPYVVDWESVKQKEVMNKLADAAGKNKLAAGIRDVWREARSLKGRLLVVEKNYMYAAERGSSDELIYKAIGPYNKFSYIKDAVDDVMEKVLENGGDVEFVDEGVLKDYHKIALVQFY